MTYEGSGAEPAAAPRSLIVVLDWVGELKRLVPTQVHGLSGRSVPFEVLIQPLRKRSGSICPSLPWRRVFVFVLHRRSGEATIHRHNNN